MQAKEKRSITYEIGLKNGLVIPLGHSGQVVTPEVAMSIAAVNAAVRLISTSIASLPLVTYRKRADGGRDRANNEPIYRLLHDQPNPAMTPAVFWELAVSTVLLRGNFYAEIERAGDGTPLALWPITDDSVTPELLDTGEIVYTVGNQGETLSSWDVVHFVGYSDDGIKGKSVIEHARESFGLTRAMEIGSSASFKNLARPSGVLTYPGELTPEMAENLKRSFGNEYAGAEKTGSVIVLEENATFDPVSVDASSMQLVECRGFQLQEIARFFQISPTKLGDLGRATWSNLESENLSFVQNTLRPWLLKIEQELNRKMGLVGTDLYCEFLVDAFMRGSTAERYECYTKALASNWLTVDEVRQRENLPALPKAEAEPVEEPAAPLPTLSDLLQLKDQPPELAKAALSIAYPALSAEQIGQFVAALPQPEPAPVVEQPAQEQPGEQQTEPETPPTEEQNGTPLQ